MYAVEKEEKTDTDVSQSASQLSEWVSEYVKQWQCFGDRNTHVKKTRWTQSERARESD